MPRLKTKSGAKKRFALTGAGRVKRAQAYKNHILTSKTRKRKRMLRQKTTVHPVQEKQILRLLAL